MQSYISDLLSFPGYRVFLFHILIIPCTKSAFRLAFYHSNFLKKFTFLFLHLFYFQSYFPSLLCIFACINCHNTFLSLHTAPNITNCIFFSSVFPDYSRVLTIGNFFKNSSSIEQLHFVTEKPLMLMETTAHPKQ